MLKTQVTVFVTRDWGERITYVGGSPECWVGGWQERWGAVARRLASVGVGGLCFLLGLQLHRQGLIQQGI